MSVCPTTSSRPIPGTLGWALLLLPRIPSPVMVQVRKEAGRLTDRLVDDLEPSVEVMLDCVVKVFGPQVLLDREEQTRRWLLIRACLPGGSCAHRDSAPGLS